MSSRNAFTEKCVAVDDVLSMLMEKPKGTLVSYTEITKGLHSYVRTKGLRLKTCPRCNAPLALSRPTATETSLS